MLERALLWADVGLVCVYPHEMPPPPAIETVVLVLSNIHFLKWWPVSTDANFYDSYEFFPSSLFYVICCV